jgi:hypothetical protein
MVQAAPNDHNMAGSLAPQSFSVPEVGLLIVLVSGFGVWCLFGWRGVVGWWCPVCSGVHRLRLRRAALPLASRGWLVLVMRMRYRPGLLDGFLAKTRLDLSNPGY